MICGVKWKSCECPWFTYDAVEQDRLDHMETPIHVRLDPDRMGSTGVPGSPRDFRAAPPPGYGGVRPRPQNYEEEIAIRRLQEQRDEELAQRIQYDEPEDDYSGGLGDIIGVGNTSGHFMNDDYRRAPQPHIVPPVPPPALPVPFDRASTGDYVSGVNRARGVRASSMERRLADRFSEQRHGTSPTHRSFSHPIPHQAPPPMAMGPPPAPPPAPIHRRHTAEEELYNTARNTRGPERAMPRRARGDYEAEAADQSPSSRRRHRERAPPKDSVLAGLTGQGRGMNRVFEWRNHVKPGDPGFDASVAG